MQTAEHSEKPVEMCTAEHSERPVKNVQTAEHSERPVEMCKVLSTAGSGRLLKTMNRLAQCSGRHIKLGSAN